MTFNKHYSAKSLYVQVEIQNGKFVSDAERLHALPKYARPAAPVVITLSRTVNDCCGTSACVEITFVVRGVNDGK